MLGALLATAAFAVGLDTARQILSPYLRPDKAAEAVAKVVRITPDPTWTFLIFVIVWGYFAFLSVLPLILEHHPEDKIDS
jgi:hypothetical protein